MKYELNTHKRIDKFLEKHPEIKILFFQKFEEISENPFQNSCDIKALVGKTQSLSAAHQQISFFV